MFNLLEQKLNVLRMFDNPSLTEMDAGFILEIPAK